MRHALLVSISAAVFISVAGCIVVASGDSTRPATMGKQLQDLKVARDSGAINDQEFEQSKAKLLNGGR